MNEIMNYNQLRRATQSTAFPYDSKSVPFICITPDGGITIAQKKQAKLEMLYAAVDGAVILAPWPGQWSQDVFLLDDWGKAKEALL